MHGCSVFLGIKKCGFSKLWVLKMCGYKNCGYSNLLVFKVYGFSKFLLFEYSNLKICAYSNLWVFKICGYMYSFLAHLSQRLRGELVVYKSSQRPSGRACICPSVCSHFQT